MAKSYYKDIVGILKENGCYLDRSPRGSHEIWYSPVNNMTFPVSKKCKSRHVANQIMKQAGLQKAF